LGQIKKSGKDAEELKALKDAPTRARPHKIILEKKRVYV